MRDEHAPLGGAWHSDYAAQTGLVMTVYPASSASVGEGPQEVVVLSSVRANRDGQLVAEAVRMWVTDLAGTGLERELMDPVVILREPDRGEGADGLRAFHLRAVVELSARRGVDYEVADLFAEEP